MKGCHSQLTSKIYGFGNEKLTDGCHEAPSNEGQICICSNNLCNGAVTKIRSDQFMFIAMMGITALLQRIRLLF